MTPSKSHSLSLSKNTKKHTNTIQGLCKNVAAKTHELQNILLQYIKEQESDAVEKQLTSSNANIYAQMVAYCIFVASYQNTKQELLHFETIIQNFKHPKDLSKILVFVKEIYMKHADCKACLDHMILLFQNIDIPKIFRNLPNPMIYFYEHFLEAFEKKMRNKRGVFYTPLEIVSFMSQKTHLRLQQDFSLKQGLASTETWSDVAKYHPKATAILLEKPHLAHLPFVQILDPATGTGNFILESIRTIRNTMLQVYQEQKLSLSEQQQDWNEYVRGHGKYQGCGLLDRMCAFEIMTIPYFIFHIQIVHVLQEHPTLPFYFHEDDIIPIVLGNALDSLAKENSPMLEIKEHRPITVIIGNPPYKGEGETRNAWINTLIDDYRCEPGGVEKLQEQQSKWLGDDYVRFIRLSQYILERVGLGILSFINPHGYIDNPTFRGMRWHLLTFFQHIEIIDLHGNANRQETTPEGKQDDNVFFIRQGVAINLFSRFEISSKTYADVFHTDIFGLRKEKLAYIKQHIHKAIEYTNVTISPKNLLRLCPSNMEHFEAYLEQSFCVHELFRVTGAGMTTAHDAFVISFRKEDLISTFEQFQNTDVSTEELYQQFQVRKKQGWDIEMAHKKFKHSIANIQDYIYPINYRPFDQRYVMYEDSVIWSSGKKALKHYILGDNIGLIFSRTVNGPFDWQDIQITKYLIEYGIMAARVGNGAPSAPLYTYSENGQRQYNLIKEKAQSIVTDIGLTYVETEPSTIEEYMTNNKVSPIHVIDYIYAYLHAPSYRKEFVEYLKKDYPRVPYPKHAKAFWNLVDIGQQLRKLHLFESFGVEDRNDTKYPFCGEGDNRITKMYSKKKSGFLSINDHIGRVYINDTQYFDMVPISVWNFFVGGYQPAQQWLKSKKRDYDQATDVKHLKISRKLSQDDIHHYQKILYVMEKTIQYMKKIDHFLLPSSS